MDELTRRALLRALAAFTAVLVIGGSGVFAIGVLRDRGVAQIDPTASPTGSVTPGPGQDEPTWLVWVPGGLPDGFGPRLTTVPLVGDVTVATADIAWMTGSVDAGGVPIDQPSAPYMIPIDTTGFEPAFASFVPTPERALVADLQPSEGVLSESSARLRGLGEGAILTFDTGQIVTVVGTLPDHLMGGYELMVTRATGETIGITHERYGLFHLKPRAITNPDRLAALFLPYVPQDFPYGHVEVRAPGQTRYLRANDRELRPLALKQRFKEFAAYPDPDLPGALRIDPTWVQEHIASQTLPILGTVTCHAKALGYLAETMNELLAADRASTITDVGPCFEPVASPDDPRGPLTATAFGAAIDLNADQNEPGQPPSQEPTLVRSMYRGGFGWGGRDAYPLGARFRYVHRPRATD